MRNFFLGLLFGWSVAYVYFTQDTLQAAISDLWDTASAPPASEPARTGHGRR